MFEQQKQGVRLGDSCIVDGFLDLGLVIQYEHQKQQEHKRSLEYKQYLAMQKQATKPVPTADRNFILADKKSPPVSRVGRNERCPCGSGKKYKKCCGKLGV